MAKALSGSKAPSPMRRDAVIRDLKALAAKLQRPIDAADLRRRKRLVAAIAATFGDLSRALRAARLPEAPSRPKAMLRGRENVMRALRASGGQRPVGALAFACRREFGSVRAARKAAGLGELRGLWAKRSHAALLDELRALGDRRAPAGLARACKREFGSVRDARIAAGMPVIKEDWSKPAVIAAIRRVHNGPLSAAVTAACKRHFGSVAAARRAAGGAPLLAPWTRERVVETLRRGGRRTGALSRACLQFFGSHAAARAAAGVVTKRRNWTPDDVLVELRKTGGNANHMHAVCVRHFGSIQAARVAAGILPPSKSASVAAKRRAPAPITGDGSLVRSRGQLGWVQRWTRERIVEALQQCGERAPSAALAIACQRHFGSIRAARDAAGLGGTGNQRWSAAMVVERLRARGAAGVDTPLRKACGRYFGSVAAARQAAHLPARHRWTEAALFAEFRARARAGTVARSSDFSSGFQRAAVATFGSFVAACEAAGVPFTSGPAPAWTRDRLLDAIRTSARGKARIGHKDFPIGVHRAATRLFGGLAAACAEAGLVYGLYRGYRPRADTSARVQQPRPAGRRALRSAAANPPRG